jgi:hypothetical protein
MEKRLSSRSHIQEGKDTHVRDLVHLVECLYDRDLFGEDGRISEPLCAMLSLSWFFKNERKSYPDLEGLQG